ncbi:hypothetical protein [Actinoplanes subglobosus]|uniref:Lipoprotein n=1 Tax=Actinoplanes subglobosus TaxID=1547892 RepID=A0ABV8J5K0_9ACTN
MHATRRHPLLVPLAAVSAAAVTATIVAVTSGQSASATGTNQTTAMVAESFDERSCGTDVVTINTTNYRQVRIVGNWFADEADGTTAATLKFFVVGRDTGQWQLGELALADRSAKTIVLDVPGTSLVVRASCNGTSATMGLLAYGN